MRTVNSAKNAIASIVYLVLKTLLDFALRTVFIYMLGNTYLGVNGLFSNILMILNLAELGVGNAIIYNLYKPVAQKDTERIRSLMALYRNCYHTIGIAIFVAGLCLVPFLDMIIKYDTTAIQHVRFIFLLYLLNSALSYFMVYKTNLVVVNQKNYTITLIRMIFEVVLVILQILSLLIFRSFYVYLVILIANTILCNFISSKYAEKMYPEETKYKNAKKITKQEKKGIFKNVRALMMYKIGGVVLNGTDSIIISSFIGISIVGIYSNYLLVIDALKKVLLNIFNSVVASVGNLNSTEDREKSLEVYYELNFLTFFLFGFCSIAVVCVMQHFLTFWLGTEYLFTKGVLIIIVANFYIYGINNISIIYRNTLGLFVKGKYRPLFAGCINIVLSIILAKKYGIAGVLFATTVSHLLTTSWYDPYMILKYGFQKRPWVYFAKMLQYLMVVILALLISEKIVSFIPQTNILFFVIDVAICFVIFSLLCCVFFGKSKEVSGLLQKIKFLLRSKRK